jgi:hypothetical protein
MSDWRDVTDDMDHRPRPGETVASSIKLQPKTIRF